jgi:hypothetical protein
MVGCQVPVHASLVSAFTSAQLRRADSRELFFCHTYTHTCVSLFLFLHSDLFTSFTLWCRTRGESSLHGVALTPTQSHDHALCNLLACAHAVFFAQAAGCVFHFSRVLYFKPNCTAVLELLRHFSGQVFPEAWSGTGAELDAVVARLRRPRGDGGGGVGVGEMGNICRWLWMSVDHEDDDNDNGNDAIADLAMVDRVISSQLGTAVADTDVPDGYHCAMLLHAFVVAAISYPALLPPMRRCIRSWLPARRDDLWRQYNAEVSVSIKSVPHVVGWPIERFEAARMPPFYHHHHHHNNNNHHHNHHHHHNYYHNHHHHHHHFHPNHLHHHLHLLISSSRGFLSPGAIRRGD